MNNFIIYALPRSRTAWLSKFLSYKDITCLHEPAVTLRTIEDIPFLFKNNTGVAETGAAQGWWLIKYYVPHIKTVVIKRSVEEVVNSLLKVDLSNKAFYDKDTLTKHMNYTNRMLDKISQESGVLTVNYYDLPKMETCKSIFEHCLPYKFDIKWWASLKNKNIQVSVKDKLLYYHKHLNEINNFKNLCKKELIRIRRMEPNNALWQRR
jgi:hypothetical protein